MNEEINLKDIKNGQLIDLIDEYLLEEGIIVYNWHEKDCLDICIIGNEYIVVYANDVKIHFEEINDPDYPIKMSYETIYTNSIVTLDCISQKLFDRRFYE